MITKTVPGPNFKIDNSLPCGCRINLDGDTKRLRLWYCSPHAAAFEMLEALRVNLDALLRDQLRAGGALRSLLGARCRSARPDRRAAGDGRRLSQRRSFSIARW